MPGAFIERISDRRVDWVLTGIQAKLQEYPKGTRMYARPTLLDLSQVGHATCSVGKLTGRLPKAMMESTI